MGSACCVAARDRTITNGSTSDVIPRNIRHSPSWSVRWDNRRRVAGEETSITWFSDGVATNDRLDNKSHTTIATANPSEEGSPLESFRNLTWQKSSPAEDQSVPKTQLIKSPNLSISEEGSLSPCMVPGWSNESNKGSLSLGGGSSDGWSFNSELTSVKPSGGRVSSSPSIDIQTCGVCSKLLTERSSWGTQKIISSNELAVVAILICGHVYHAECLENMTAEINQYDPVCPVCTYGEKQTFKLSEKAIRAEMELKSKINKKLRSRVVDGDEIVFDHHKSRSYKMSSSLGKPPFLKRHFSFGSKGSRSMSENNRRKGFLWAK